MKILPNFNIIHNFNYQINTPQKNSNIAFKGEEPGDTFESRIDEEEAERYAKLEDLGIKEVIVDGNKVLIENLKGDKSEVAEIPEVYFENVKDRQKEVETWLTNDDQSGHPTLGMPYDLLDKMDKLGIETGYPYTIEMYRDAKDNGIKFISYNKENGVADIEIDDMPYKFKLENNCTEPGLDDLVNEYSYDFSELNIMIDNIREAGRAADITKEDGEKEAFIIQDGKKEIVISRILDRTPDVKRDEFLVRYGNAEVYIDDIYGPLQVLSNFTKKDIDPEDIKVIKYLVKPIEGFDNNYVARAYSYYNKNCNKLYLYKPEEKTIQVLCANNSIKNFSINPEEI